MEQPKPSAGRVAVTPLVMQDLAERATNGFGDYGRPLETHNGRHSLTDIYEELLDAVQYIKQRLLEESGETPPAPVDPIASANAEVASLRQLVVAMQEQRNQLQAERNAAYMEDWNKLVKERDNYKHLLKMMQNSPGHVLEALHTVGINGPAVPGMEMDESQSPEAYPEPRSDNMAVNVQRVVNQLNLYRHAARVYLRKFGSS
jgi:hypothetical protein